MMKKKQRRKFEKSFKLEVVKRSIGKITINELSEELDIKAATISRWRREFFDSGEIESFQGNGHESLTAEQKEIRRLSSALREKELELEILKKAINIFSKKDKVSTNSFK